ncbi:MAG: MurR/RpiR family transcriptional regulator [Clostridiaceae bacterium]|nr:MurR/RpiR family transcriptional regulator [Clostridiaceae bacterium]
MNSIIFRIKTMYNDMGSAEKKIADWLLDNQGEIISLSISELAEKCGCGEATIVRFARRLGMEGYQELKLSIAQEASNLHHIVKEDIKKEDSCSVIFSKIANGIYRSLEHTNKVLNSSNLEKAVEKIIEARRVAIFGLGNSSAIAIDAQHKFLRAGLDTAAYCDNHMQAIAASHLTKDDVAIGISHSGSSIDVVEALRLSKEAGATTICITNFGKSPIVKQSDIVLFTASEETKYTIFGMNSRIAQLAIIDTIYTYIILNKSEEGLKAIRATERALQNKKY